MGRRPALADAGLAVTQDHQDMSSPSQLFRGGRGVDPRLGLPRPAHPAGPRCSWAVLARILPLSELYDHVAWPVIVLPRLD